MPKIDYNGMRMALRLISQRLNGELDSTMRDQLINRRAAILAKLRDADEKEQ